MKILLVNDDGYQAPGIQKLKIELQDYGEVFMVAPKGAMSAKSVSITIGKELEYEKIDDHNYFVAGTPADCVTFALSNLNIDFDLVVSGCNCGLNHSVCSVWSGTIGACIQAGILGVPSIAFSATKDNMFHINLYTKKAMNYILENHLHDKHHIISVNFPYTKEAKGIRFCDLSFNNGKLVFGEDGNLYQNSEHDINFIDKKSDLYYVSHGYISVTPLSLSIFNKELFESMKNKCKNVDF